MQLEHVACYLCGESRSEPWARESGYSMVKCLNCGLVYLNPRPLLSDIDAAARTGMHRLDRGVLRMVGRHSSLKVDEFCQKTSALFPQEELRSEPCRWLDIGAGFGELLEALDVLVASGSELLGLEPCEAKVKWCQSRGIPVTSAELRDISGEFTHVSLVNVFSHLPDPVEFFEGLRIRLKPRGQLLLATGNAGDIPRSEFPGSLYLPDHLSFSGEGHMRAILDKAGYKVIAMQRYRAGVTGENRLVGHLKNLARKSLRRPAVPLRIDENSRFRFLWIRAERCA